MQTLRKELETNAYPGRGIIIGKSEDGQKAVFAYFIMGRSENSRNRIFVKEGDSLFTRAFDASKLSDPSLVIYAPVRVLGNKTIVTNGDQTDTIYEMMNRQFTFEQALQTRAFEPDPPIYTPRISGIINRTADDFNYALSILKSADGDPASCRRQFFCYYNALCGQGHFIHTYAQDGNPPKSFAGEPKQVEIPNDLQLFGDTIWGALDAENKVSLYVRSISLADGSYQDSIYNKNK